MPRACSSQLGVDGSDVEGSTRPLTLTDVGIAPDCKSTRRMPCWPSFVRTQVRGFPSTIADAAGELLLSTLDAAKAS
eukprot:scaffold7345_cov293-Pinguiococcus_pyrenoidosus.AAC.2